VSIIPGGAEIGEKLVTHSGVDAIGFTGSSETGRRIISQMGIKRSIMEMSGNGPTIVTDDANLEAAAELAVYGAYYNAGQVCCATERVIVVDAIHDEFVELALKASEQVRLGDPFDETTNMGPLNNEPTAAKMDRHLADAADTQPICTTSSPLSTVCRKPHSSRPRSRSGRYFRSSRLATMKRL